MGCGVDDPNCASTTGCGGGGDDDGTTPDGGNPQDCTPNGNVSCPAPMAVHATCDDQGCSCDDPAYPVTCGGAYSGYCWPAGTTCDYGAFPCKDLAAVCTGPDQAANCCGSEAHLCPADAPYYCTEDGTCRAPGNECHSTCQYYGAGC